MVPLLLLDVDGVLNALGEPDELQAAWPEWIGGSARSALSSWPIAFSPVVAAQLVQWHREGQLEIQWLTTWGHDANDELRVLLGFPALEVAGTHDEVGATAEVGVSLASVTPSAPDALTGQWWKHDVVRRVLAEHPNRTIVWADDELHRATAFRTWADAQPRMVAIGPNPLTGLSQSDLDTIAIAIASAEFGPYPTCR